MLFNAVLVGFEFSLMRVRFSHFNPYLLDRMNAIPGMQHILENPESYGRGARFGSAFATMGFGVLMIPLLEAVFGAASFSVGVETGILPLVLAVVAAIGLHYTLVELMPLALGPVHPFLLLRRGRYLVRATRLLFGPIMGLSDSVAKFFLRSFRLEEPGTLDSLDVSEQISALQEESGPEEEVVLKILKSALMLRDLEVSDVLLPRNQVKIFDLEESLEDNLSMARETGHTRFPLCHGDLDRCVGLIHIKDLFRYPGELPGIDLREIQRDIMRIQADERLDESLRMLLSAKMHMALVVDEFGGVEGVLTLERILEQLVGDIKDEFDTDEESLVREAGPTQETVVSGLLPVHELEGVIGVVVENDEVSTLGGLITSELGRIPEVGEQLEVEGIHITVTDVDETRVKEAIVVAIDPSVQSGRNDDRDRGRGDERSDEPPPAGK